MNRCKGRYLIAVSGGPDSMALLSMSLLKYELIEVAHVNYHKRESANKDEKIVREFCKKNNIKFYKKDCLTYEGNFQDYARVFRYKFFSEIIKKDKLNGVLVAHHLDDFLETYYLQINRGSIPHYYGLNKEVIIQDVKVKRPLLKYTKNDLLNYCVKNNIAYGIDESNLTDHYSRNKIRHSLIEKMSLKEKKELKKKIDLLNTKKSNKEKEIKKYLNNKRIISIERFNEYKDKKDLLRYLIKEDLSNKYLEDLLKQINECESFEVLINDEYFVKEYGYLEVYKKEDDYEYVLKRIDYKEYPFFKISNKGDDFIGVTIKKSDYPIRIRNFKKGDAIKMRYGTKKISRFFIDNKIRSKYRKLWPIILNSANEVIMVPGIGSNITHYSDKHNMYVIELMDKAGK